MGILTLRISSFAPPQVTSDRRVYMKSNFHDGLALDNVHVHPTLVAQLDAACEECIHTGSHMDLQVAFAFNRNREYII